MSHPVVQWLWFMRYTSRTDSNPSVGNIILVSVYSLLIFSNKYHYNYWNILTRTVLIINESTWIRVMAAWISVQWNITSPIVTLSAISNLTAQRKLYTHLYQTMSIYYCFPLYLHEVVFTSTTRRGLHKCRYWFYQPSTRQWCYLRAECTGEIVEHIQCCKHLAVEGEEDAETESPERGNARREKTWAALKFCTAESEASRINVPTETGNEEGRSQECTASYVL